MTATLSHRIAGLHRAASPGRAILRHNPSDRDDLVAEVPVGGEREVDAAVDAASRAFEPWRRWTGPARADRLHAWGDAIQARSDDFAAAIVREAGKPIVEARGEVARAVVICRYYAGEAVRATGEVIPAGAPDALQFTVRDPLGPVVLITPWNFPVAIPLWKAAPALAFGNTVILKPSEHASRVADLLAETAAVAGFPEGAFSVIYGDGETGALLVDHPGVRGISFTGSAAVGARVRVAAAARNVRCQAEMGGKNVVIVCDDADLDRAANLTAAGAFRYAGQKCTATSRAIVDRKVAGAFLERLEKATRALKLGPLSDPDAVIGPMVTPAARDRVHAALHAAPAEVAFEGILPEGAEWVRGNWVVPRAVRITDPAHPVAREELFAPVLAVLEVDGFDDAIRLANDTRYGLSASLFTRDISRAFAYIRAIDVGLVRVNGDTTGVDPHAPFGGTKDSSSGGREQGRAARDFYTEIRTIQVHG